MACHGGKGWSLRLRYSDGYGVETYNAGSREGVPTTYRSLKTVASLIGLEGEPLAAPRGVSDASRRCKQRPSKFLVGGRFFQRSQRHSDVTLTSHLRHHEWSQTDGQQ